MRHLKTYEGSSDYNIGDWVLLDKRGNWTIFLEVEIIDIIGHYHYKIKGVASKDFHSDHDGEYKDYNAYDIVTFENISRSLIVRKLTPDEIEIAKIKPEANKFNL